MPIGDKGKFFTEIYSQEADSVFRFSLLRVSDRDKALELTQETFARLWQSMALGRKVENPRAFIYKVARNLIIDWYIRKKPVSLEGLSLDETEREFEVVDEKASSSIEISYDAKRALSLLDKLLPEYREVIYWRFVEDLSPKEIAEILDLNANVVSIRITRGMEMLRKLMGINNKQ